MDVGSKLRNIPGRCDYGAADVGVEADVDVDADDGVNADVDVEDTDVGVEAIDAVGMRAAEEGLPVDDDGPAPALELPFPFLISSDDPWNKYRKSSSRLFSTSRMFSSIDSFIHQCRLTCTS